MMRLQFQEYQPRKIVNVHRHVGGRGFGIATAPILMGVQIFNSKPFHKTNFLTKTTMSGIFYVLVLDVS